MLDELAGRHAGETAYIVAKGPSLTRLDAGCFGPGPILTLNEAILPVQTMGLANPIYSLQNDGTVTIPAGGVTLLTNSACPYDASPHLEWNAEAMGLGGHQALVILVAIELAKLMGCASLVVLCADSLTSRDLRTCTHTSADEYRVCLEQDQGSGMWSAPVYEGMASAVLAGLASIDHVLVTPGG